MDLPEGIGIIPNDYSLYKPLNSEQKEIRLLRLTQHQESSAISAELIHCSLHSGDCPKYYALSYCWGGLNDLRTISINDKPFSVTSNLETALRRLLLDPSENNLVTKLGVEYKSRAALEGMGPGRIIYAEYKRLKRPGKELHWYLPREGEVPSSSETPRETRNSSDADSCSVLLWVDAICINQADIQERSNQVAMMLDMYKNARKTLVWLGEDEGCDTSLDDCLETVVKWLGGALLHSTSVKLRLVTGSPDQPGGTDLRKFKEEHAEQESDPNTALEGARSEEQDGNGDSLARMLFQIPVEQLRSLNLFFKKPWFRRLWVLQEVWAAQDVEVLFGYAAISWDLVTLTCRWIRFALDRLRFHRSDNAWKLLNEAQLPEIWQLLAQIGPEDPEMHNAFQVISRSDLVFDEPISSGIDLRKLILSTLEFRCSDPRDRIYALLGISTDFRNCPPHLRPDYSKTKKDVFCAFVRAIIEQSKSLAVLSDIQSAPPDVALSLDPNFMRQVWREGGINVENPQNPDVFEAWFHALNEYSQKQVQAENKDPNLPTWVPDWKSRQFTNYQPFTGYDQVAAHVPAIIDHCDEENVLRVRGHIIEALQYVSLPFDAATKNQLLTMRFRMSPMEDDGEGDERWIQGPFLIPLWHMICDNLETHPYPDLLRAYMLSLVYVGLPIEEDWDQLVHASQENHSVPTTDPTIEADFAALWAKTDPNLTEMPPEGRDHFLPLVERGSANRFAQAVKWACEHRCFCVTTRGFLGVCTPNARPGDFVCLFLGGPSLYILRHLGSESENDQSDHLDGDDDHGGGTASSDQINRFAYIGECNIQQLSSPDTLKYLEEQERPVHTFDLR